MSAHSGGRGSNTIPIENCYRAWGPELVTQRTHQSFRRHVQRHFAKCGAPLKCQRSAPRVPAERPSSASGPPQQSRGQHWDQFGLAAIPAAHFRAGLNGNKNPRR
jgi:hypothetical protein